MTQNALANNGIFRHGLKVLGSDNVSATSSGNKDVGAMSSIFHGGDFVTGHSSLKSVDMVDFGDQDTGTV